MIQDIAPHSLRNQYCERTEPAGDNPVFCFRGPKLLVLRNAGHSFEKTAGAAFNQERLSMPEDGEDEKQFYLERGRYLRLPEVRDLGAGREYTYLFTVDGRPVFLLREDLKEDSRRVCFCGYPQDAHGGLWPQAQTLFSFDCLSAVQLVPGQPFLRDLRPSYSPFGYGAGTPLS